MPTFSPASLAAWSDGTTVDDTLMNAQIKVPIEDLRTKLGSWTSWTPVLTAATTNPTNYTATGQYIQVGDLVVANFRITTGASWTNGSGAYSLSLPVTAVLGTGSASSGAARLVFTGGNTYGTPQLIAGGTTFRIIYMTSFTASAPFAHNAPASWPVSAETVNGQVIYQAA